MRFDPQSNFLPGQKDPVRRPSEMLDASQETGAGLQAGVVVFVVAIGAVFGVWLWTQAQQQESLLGGTPSSASAAAPELNDPHVTADAGDHTTTESEAAVSGSDVSATSPASTHAADTPAATASSDAEQPTADQTRSTQTTLTRKERLQRSREAYDRGRSRLLVGKHRQAVPHFIEAIELDPQFTKAHYNLGLSSVMVGDLETARREQQTLAELDPSLASLLDNLLRR